MHRLLPLLIVPAALAAAPSAMASELKVVAGTLTYVDTDPAAANTVTVTLDGKAGDGEAGENDNVGTDVENVNGGAGNDVLTGSDADNVLAGNGGDDTLSGGDGNDNLQGGAGNDTLAGGNGGDSMSGGDGTDRVT